MPGNGHNPTKKGLPTQPGRKRWRKWNSRSRSVDVVFEQMEDKLCIVTVIDIEKKRVRFPAERRNEQPHGRGDRGLLQGARRRLIESKGIRRRKCLRGL